MKTDLKFKAIVDKLANFRFSKIEFYKYIQLSDWELQLIKEIISTSNSKVYLREVYLKITNLKDAIEIVDLLSDCMNLEYVDIHFKYGLTSENTDSEKAIRKAKHKIYKKVCIACKVRFTQDLCSK